MNLSGSEGEGLFLAHPCEISIINRFSRPARFIHLSSSDETWILAAEKSFGWEGKFEESYLQFKTTSDEAAIDTSPIGRPIEKLIRELCTWTGNHKGLLQILEENYTDKLDRRNADWPRNATKMASELGQSTQGLT